MEHLKEDEIIDFIENKVDENKKKHINVCKECQKKIEDFKDFLNFLQEIISKRPLCLSVERIQADDKTKEEEGHLLYCPLCSMEKEILDNIKEKKERIKIPLDFSLNKIFQNNWNAVLYRSAKEEKIPIEEGEKVYNLKEYQINLKITKDKIIIKISPPPTKPLFVNLISTSFKRRIKIEKEIFVIERALWTHISIEE